MVRVSRPVIGRILCLTGEGEKRMKRKWDGGGTVLAVEASKRGSGETTAGKRQIRTEEADAENEEEANEGVEEREESGRIADEADEGKGALKAISIRWTISSRQKCVTL